MGIAHYPTQSIPPLLQAIHKLWYQVVSYALSKNEVRFRLPAYSEHHRAVMETQTESGRLSIDMCWRFCLDTPENGDPNWTSVLLENGWQQLQGCMKRAEHNRGGHRLVHHSGLRCTCLQVSQLIIPHLHFTLSSGDKVNLMKIMIINSLTLACRPQTASFR